MATEIKKVVLAYSGGLDTSIILKWLQETYGCEVVTFTADLGQGEELAPARKKAELLGIKEIYVEDLREEFVRDFVFPMFRANALYEGVYLLGTSIARPLIAKRQIEIARETGADAVAHGATGKGNDQVRFELTYYALNPDIKVIAPWREWAFKSRSDLIEFAEKHQIQVAKDKRGEAPFSVDANLLHSSSEGKVLEDPAVEPPPYVYQRTIAPEDAPDKATVVRIGFKRGDPVSIDGKALSPAVLLTRLNELGGDNGIGRVDLVENRYVGMKSRGVYETPGGTILHVAHRAIESLTLDREAMHLKDALMPRYAELVYYGFWFSPEREMLQALVDKSQEHVEGEVTLKLYKGNVIVIGRSIAEVALLRQDRHLRGRRRRLRPEGRGRLHQAECAAFAAARQAPRFQDVRPMAWPDRRLLDLFGVELPIVQAPMANSSGVDMAVAAAEAGGLGSFPCAGLTDDKVRDGVAAIRSRTKRPINLNFFCHAEPEQDVAREAAWLERLAPYYAELGVEMPKPPLKATIYRFTEATCGVVEELRPEVVSFHFGLPAAELVRRVKQAGCKVICSATTRREALWLAERGVDAVIAQGAEAGGHRGMFIETEIATQIGTFALVQQIVEAVDVPVIAAGRH